MPSIRRVLETALYFDDLRQATEFYCDVLGLRVIARGGSRLVALDAGEATVLLLFRRGATLGGADTPEGWIPPHDGHGPVHVAFAVAADAIDGWERRLAERGIAIESHVRWEGGGRSIYFRDPAGHCLELATPGTWTTY